MTKLKTVSGECLTCGEPFTNKYKPAHDWEPSKEFYCLGCISKLLDSKSYPGGNRVYPPEFLPWQKQTQAAQADSA
jgi:hypothetical protein